MASFDQVVKALYNRLDDDNMAKWLAEFNYDLRGRPIVLCESVEGRQRVLDYAESRMTHS